MLLNFIQTIEKILVNTFYRHQLNPTQKGQADEFSWSLLGNLNDCVTDH